MKTAAQAPTPRTVLTRKRYLTQLSLWAASMILFILYTLTINPFGAADRLMAPLVAIPFIIAIMLCCFTAPSAPAAPELPDKALDRFLPSAFISALLRFVLALTTAGFLLGALSFLFDINAVCTDGVYALMRNGSVLCKVPKWLCVSCACISELRREFCFLFYATSRTLSIHNVYRLLRPEQADLSQE